MYKKVLKTLKKEEQLNFSIENENLKRNADDFVELKAFSDSTPSDFDPESSYFPKKELIHAVETGKIPTWKETKLNFADQGVEGFEGFPIEEKVELTESNEPMFFNHKGKVYHINDIKNNVKSLSYPEYYSEVDPEKLNNHYYDKINSIIDKSHEPLSDSSSRLSPHIKKLANFFNDPEHKKYINQDHFNYLMENKNKLFDNNPNWQKYKSENENVSEDDYFLENFTRSMPVKFYNEDSLKNLIDHPNDEIVDNTLKNLVGKENNHFVIDHLLNNFFELDNKSTSNYHKLGYFLDENEKTKLDSGLFLKKPASPIKNSEHLSKIFDKLNEHQQGLNEALDHIQKTYPKDSKSVVFAEGKYQTDSKKIDDIKEGVLKLYKKKNKEHKVPNNVLESLINGTLFSNQKQISISRFFDFFDHENVEKLINEKSIKNHRYTDIDRVIQKVYDKTDVENKSFMDTIHNKILNLDTKNIHNAIFIKNIIQDSDWSKNPEFKVKAFDKFLDSIDDINKNFEKIDHSDLGSMLYNNGIDRALLQSQNIDPLFKLIDKHNELVNKKIENFKGSRFVNEEEFKKDSDREMALNIEHSFDNDKTPDEIKTKIGNKLLNTYKDEDSLENVYDNIKNFIPDSIKKDHLDYSDNPSLQRKAFKALTDNRDIKESPIKNDDLAKLIEKNDGSYLEDIWREVDRRVSYDYNLNEYDAQLHEYEKRRQIPEVFANKDLAQKILLKDYENKNIYKNDLKNIKDSFYKTLAHDPNKSVKQQDYDKWYIDNLHKFDDTHIDTIIRNAKSPELLEKAYDKAKLGIQNYNRFAKKDENNYKENNLKELVFNENLPTKIAHDLLFSNDFNIDDMYKKRILANHNATHEQLEKLLDRYSPYENEDMYSSIIKNKNFKTDETIKKLHSVIYDSYEPNEDDYWNTEEYDPDIHDWAESEEDFYERSEPYFDDFYWEDKKRHLSRFEKFDDMVEKLVSSEKELNDQQIHDIIDIYLDEDNYEVYDDNDRGYGFKYDDSGLDALLHKSNVNMDHLRKIKDSLFDDYHNHSSIQEALTQNYLLFDPDSYNGETQVVRLLNDNDDFNEFEPVKVKVNKDLDFLKMIRHQMQNLEIPKKGIAKGVLKKKIGPIIDKYPQIFDATGKTNLKTMDEIIDKSEESSDYINISFDSWKSYQRHDDNHPDYNNKQLVVQVNLTNIMMQKLIKENLLETFKEIFKSSQNSGHPIDEHTIGWARVDTYKSNDGHWHIDEIQSDFGSDLSAIIGSQLREYKEKASEAEGKEAELQVEEWLNKHLKKYQRISEIVSLGHDDPNHLIQSAVMQLARKNNMQSISFDHPDVQAYNHSGLSRGKSVPVHQINTYKKRPKKLGFKMTDKKKIYDKWYDDDDETYDKWQDENQHIFQYAPLYRHELDALYKGELGQAAKGLLLSTALGIAAHSVGEKKNIEAKNNSTIARDVSSEKKIDPTVEAYNQARKEGEDIIKRNQKNWFLDKKATTMSPIVYKQTIKNSPELSEKYGHTLKYNNRTFRDVIEKNPHLRNDVHSAHFDKLHNEFEGSLDKISHAWQNGIKATHKAFNTQEPVNYTHKRMRKDEQEIGPSLNTTGQKPNKIREVADAYAQSKGMVLNHDIPKAKVHPEHAKMIADAYDRIQHNPDHKQVQNSYNALINETTDQFNHIINNTGLKISKITPDMKNPYANSKELFKDIHENNHLWFYPTDIGYGSGEGDQGIDHPMLKPTSITHEGQPLLANDLFRIVHDYFGHAKEGNGFGANGEENAWMHHKQMYSPLAAKALTAETKMQNSWVNFGPHGEHNRKNPAQTIYADQKAIVAPDWIVNHSHPEHFQKSELIDLFKGDVIDFNEFKRKKAMLDGVPSDGVRIKTEPVDHTKDLHPAYHSDTFHSLHARFKNEDQFKSRLDKLHKQLHDEPYKHGDVHNVHWGDAGDAYIAHGMWNRPIPIPVQTHPNKVNGVLGKEVHAGGPDPFAFLDLKYKVGLKTLKDHKDLPLIVNTRSDLIAYDQYMEHLNPDLHTINIHVYGDNDNFNTNIEPGAPSFKRRLKAAQKLQRNGFKVNIVHNKLTGYKDEGENYHKAIHNHLNNVVEVDGKRYLAHDGVHIPLKRMDHKLSKMARQRIFKNTGIKLYGEDSLDKSEDLMKGSLQRRNPFNPMSTEAQQTRDMQRGWTVDEFNSAKKALKPMNKFAKIRAMNKLASQTKVSRHPETGERMFLMHRGASDEEFNEFSDGVKLKYPKGHRNSWTPNIRVANDFGTGHSDLTEKEGTGGMTASAWIPESKLIHSVNQFNSPEKEVDSKIKRNLTEKEEQEWIVEHDDNYIYHANPEVVGNTQDIHSKINRRGINKNEDDKNKGLKNIIHEQKMWSESGRPMPLDDVDDSFDPIKGKKEDVKIKETLEQLKTDTPNPSKMFQRVYSVPSEEKMARSKKAVKSGQVPDSINVYGSHFPVVKLLNEDTLLLHTSDYGKKGKTREIVDKIKNDLPEYFPNFKVIEIHHPDYRHSSKVMRMRNKNGLMRFLEDAAANHPNEDYQAHAFDALAHLAALKKGEYTKPIHAKRTATEGYDAEKNMETRINRINNYLTSIGLTPDMSVGQKRDLGATTPTSVNINVGGDPEDQQMLHEGGHAMLTPEGVTLEEYQSGIGEPGFKGKLHQSKHRQALKESHGGGMPEQTAQQMEGMIARRAGVEPFRSPQRGASDKSEAERSRQHAKKQMQMFDEGILRFDPFSGENELQGNIHSYINAKKMGDNKLAEKIRQKLITHIKNKKKLKEQGYDLADMF